MSKVTFVGSTSKTISSDSIAKGTFFTGKVNGYKERHFFKYYQGIVSFPDGGTWLSGCPVEDYCECDVDMVFKPVL